MMKRVDIIKRALELCVAEKGALCGAKEPYSDGEYQIANDGYIMLLIKDKAKVKGLRTRVYATKQIEDRFYSDGSKESVGYHYKSVGSLTRDWMMLNALWEKTEIVRIGDTLISREIWERTTTVMQFLGLDGFDVQESGNPDMTALMFKNETQEESYRLLVMGLIENQGNEKRHIQTLNLSKGYRNLDDENDPRNRCRGIDEKEAELFIKNYDKKEAKRQADLRLKRRGNLWEVAVTKIGYFYVEAADENEAKLLAQEHYHEVDEDDVFEDSDVGLEGVQDNTDIDCLDSNAQIYTVDDGWCDLDEYQDIYDKYELMINN